MNNLRDRKTIIVAVAHHDDWQLFMGKEVYAHLRDPDKKVVFIVTTAGNGPHGDFHWKSRLCGAVVSVLRALPSWSPYAALPAAFSVAYEEAAVNGKTVLACTILDERAARVRLYFMHLTDGGPAAQGFAPAFESLAKLHDGHAPLHTLWPQERPSLYQSWEEFESTLEAIMLDEATESAAPVRVYAANPDRQVNPGDHADHYLTSQAVAGIADRHARFRPVWFSMYCNAEKPENLDGADADDQRAAIFAYGGGYMSTAAGFGEAWRTGWEREYPVFKNRQYPKDDALADD